MIIRRYTEIIKLKMRLDAAKIPYEIERVFDGWQICYPSKENKVSDAIEFKGSYGCEQNLIEIRGLLTDDEQKKDTVVGYLTADEVFRRWSAHYDKERGKLQIVVKPRENGKSARLKEIYEEFKKEHPDANILEYDIAAFLHKSKWVYRVESISKDNGLWYDSNGRYVFGIGALENCPSKSFPMGYDERYHKDGKCWRSSCSNISDLFHWFSADNIMELANNGFVFARYLAVDYVEYEFETTFLLETSIEREEIDIRFLKEVERWTKQE